MLEAPNANSSNKSIKPTPDLKNNRTALHTFPVLRPFHSQISSEKTPFQQITKNQKNLDIEDIKLAKWILSLYDTFLIYSSPITVCGGLIMFSIGIVALIFNDESQPYYCSKSSSIIIAQLFALHLVCWLCVTLHTYFLRVLKAVWVQAMRLPFSWIKTIILRCVRHFKATARKSRSIYKSLAEIDNHSPTTRRSERIEGNGINSAMRQLYPQNSRPVSMSAIRRRLSTIDIILNDSESDPYMFADSIHNTTSRCKPTITLNSEINNQTDIINGNYESDYWTVIKSSTIQDDFQYLTQDEQENKYMNSKTNILPNSKNFKKHTSLDDKYYSTNFLTCNTKSNIQNRVSDYAYSDYAYSDYAHSDYAYSDYAYSDYAYSDYAHSDYAYSSLTDYSSTHTPKIVKKSLSCGSSRNTSKNTGTSMSECRRFAASTVEPRRNLQNISPISNYNDKKNTTTRNIEFSNTNPSIIVLWGKQKINKTSKYINNQQSKLSNTQIINRNNKYHNKTNKRKTHNVFHKAIGVLRNKSAYDNDMTNEFIAQISSELPEISPEPLVVIGGGQALWMAIIKHLMVVLYLVLLIILYPIVTQELPLCKTAFTNFIQTYYLPFHLVVWVMNFIMPQAVFYLLLGILLYVRIKSE